MSTTTKLLLVALTSHSVHARHIVLGRCPKRNLQCTWNATSGRLGELLSLPSSELFLVQGIRPYQTSLDGANPCYAKIQTVFTNSTFSKAPFRGLMKFRKFFAWSCIPEFSFVPDLFPTLGLSDARAFLNCGCGCSSHCSKWVAINAATVTATYVAVNANGLGFMT